MADKGISLPELDPRHRYKLLCGVVVPRPIALVTTLDENAAVNAAPFSFFNVFSESPALIVLGLQHKPDHSPRRLPADRPHVRQSLHHAAGYVCACPREP
jgi:hypothetical protein